MKTYQFTVHIAAPPELVFDLWTDVDRMGEWVEGVTKVTDVKGDPGEPGTTYTVWFGPMSSPTEVLAARRPYFLRSRFGNALLRGENEVTFEPIDAGTRILQSFHVVGAVPRAAARVWATGSYRGSFRGELATFARIVEREAQGRSPGA